MLSFEKVTFTKICIFKLNFRFLMVTFGCDKICPLFGLTLNSVKDQVEAEAKTDQPQVEKRMEEISNISQEEETFATYGMNHDKDYI